MFKLSSKREKKSTLIQMTVITVNCQLSNRKFNLAHFHVLDKYANLHHASYIFSIHTHTYVCTGTYIHTYDIVDLNPLKLIPQCRLHIDSNLIF